MKLIVSVVGDFTYINPLNPPEVMYNHKACVVTAGDFVNSLLLSGKIKVLAKDLPDEAAQETFDDFVMSSEKNLDLAVASFVSTFPGATEFELKDPVDQTSKGKKKKVKKNQETEETEPELPLENDEGGEDVEDPVA